MKKTILIVGIFLHLAFNTCEAQYIIIPDTAFVSWLQNNGYAFCMTGNQLDTACGSVVNAISMSCNNSGITNITGIQYFKNLRYLNCSQNRLSNISNLPKKLDTLDCSVNSLMNMPVLPDSLKYLDCHNNRLAELYSLPSTLTYFNCGSNLLGFISISLPQGLQHFDCSQNQILGPLAFNSFPASLQILYCYGNQLGSLPTLPLVLDSLKCYSDQLSNLPSLPPSLKYLQCGDNQLSTIPYLPASLKYLDCSGNQLSSLPSLPDTLIVLYCEYNQLANLPAFPSSLANIDCSFNKLNELPTLPDSLNDFSCHNNPLLNCLPELKRIVNFIFYGTDIACVPDYGTVSISNPALGSLPLCSTANPNDCSYYGSVSSIKEFNFSIFPNPVSDYVLVTLNEEHREIILQVTDVMGRDIMTINMFDASYKLPVNQLSDGLYFVTVIDKDNLNKIITQKIVIQH